MRFAFYSYIIKLSRSLIDVDFQKKRKLITRDQDSKKTNHKRLRFKMKFKIIVIIFFNFLSAYLLHFLFFFY